MGEINLVMAREEIPEGPSVFLAGPTPERGSGVASWRPEAAAELAARWTGAGPLVVLSPESRHGVRADRYTDQVVWECAARARAGVILFWIPRDEKLLPGFTTNVEFGYDVGRDRTVVLGCPPDCPSPLRNRYLVHLAHAYAVPVRESLAETAATALALLDHDGTGGTS